MGLYPIGGRYDDGNGGAANFNGAGDTPQRILTYFQRKFIEAELALVGVTSGDPSALYEEAVRSSFAKVNDVANTAGAPTMSSTDIDDYVTAVVNMFNSANNDGKMRHLMTQKWIASFGFGVDAYTDYRRTGYPLLYDGNTDNLNVTTRTRAYPLSYPWVTGNLDINPNSPSQKEVTTYKVFWDPN